MRTSTANVFVTIVIVTIFVVILYTLHYDKYNIRIETKYLQEAKNVEYTAESKLSETEQEEKIKQFYATLSQQGRKIYSQYKEDGVIEAIFDLLNISDLKRYYVEIGTGGGDECNTRYFREHKNWTGILFDGANENAKINLNKVTIHANTVVNILEKYSVPTEIDLLSEDTDYADYWIVKAILSKYKAKVVVHEINQQLPDRCVTVPASDEVIYFPGGVNFHGGSVCAFYCLAMENQYSMVYCESAGVNCFWIRNDIIEKYLNFDPKMVQKVLNPTFLYKKPAFTYSETGKVWHEVKC